jgi:hypothetical protein
MRLRSRNDRPDPSDDPRTATEPSTADGPHRSAHPAPGHREAREAFGGTNPGAAFFGWLVAVGITVILTGVIGAVVAAVDASTTITQSEAERQAGTIGVTAAVVLLLVLVLGYYTGGYVAGRMSRFDGARQGLAVWLIGLFVTVLAGGVGALFGAQYDVLDRVDLARVPLSLEQLSWGGLVTAAAVLVLSLLAAMAGGKVGHRYHDRVDRAAGLDRPATA